MSVDNIPKNTIDRIRKIRVNALYGKKKHFNAADRKGRYQGRLDFLVITINLVLGSTFLFLLKEESAEVIKWVGAALSLVSALCVGYQKAFGFQRVAAGHRNIANRYLQVANNCHNLLSDFQDGLINAVQLAKKRDDIQALLARIDEDALSFSTSLVDYQKAQEGVSAGEENYTDAELDIGNSAQ